MSTDLLRRAARGDSSALGDLFGQHREQLRRLIQLRLDQRIRGRVDPSDVLQDTYLEFARSLSGYQYRPETPFYIWLRHIALRKIQALHRHHL